MFGKIRDLFLGLFFVLWAISFSWLAYAMATMQKVPAEVREVACIGFAVLMGLATYKVQDRIIDWAKKHTDERTAVVVVSLVVSATVLLVLF